MVPMLRLQRGSSNAYETCAQDKDAESEVRNWPIFIGRGAPFRYGARYHARGAGALASRMILARCGSPGR